mgnify:FL=1
MEARTFFLGGDLALEPSFVIVPKDSGAKQGFQVSAKVGSNRQTLAAADLAGLTTVGEAGFGRFDRQGGAIYFTANGQTGVGTLTVTLLDMTAKARISTGTGLAVRIREWDSLSYPVTVYTPGGIQIAQLPAQRDVFLWDGLADYGAQTGKQGLPGLYLFKSANGASKKEVLAQAPVKTNLTAKVAVDTGQKLVSFGSGTTPFDFGDVVYASAYIGQGSKTLGWLGTKVVKDGAALPSWKWDETYDYSPTSGDVFAYVRLVTAGGQVAVSQGAKIGTVTAPLALKQLSFTQSIWQDVYENGLLKEDQDWKYDYEAGRLISKEGKNGQGTFTYAYDFEGRLTRIDLNGQMQWNASYDGDGRKVKETNFSQDREETTFFVYDKDERLAYQKSVIKDKNGQETEKETVYPAAEESK